MQTYLSQLAIASLFIEEKLVFLFFIYYLFIVLFLLNVQNKAEQ